MPLPKITGAQRDFSGGELDEGMKRADDNPVMKTGARQMSNWRILNSRNVQNRPGRTAVFIETGRVDEVLMKPATAFYLVFTTSGDLRVYSTAGALIMGKSGFLWGAATLQSVVWVLDGLSIYITFPGMRPQVLSWDGVSTWSVTAYAETVTPGGQKRTAFFRISPQNITMAPSATTGAIAIVFSANVLVAGMVNTRMTYCGRQILITGVSDGMNGTATVEEPLPASSTVPLMSDPTGVFSVGDEVQGSISGAAGIVISLTTTDVLVQLIPTSSNSIIDFVATDIVVGPNGSVGASGAPTPGAPQGVGIWEDEVMNSFRGWPASVFFDQDRLGFCNFPSVPRGIAWSAIDSPLDLYVTALPENAIFELVPATSQVFFVVPGPESGEFVFCDNKVYYIPINATNPLIPGSISFNILSSDGAANVQPRPVEEVVFYAVAGGLRIKAVIAPGAYYRPFNTIDVTENHNHLFSNIIAIAAPNADGTFPERYCYALNAGGAVVVGKYSVRDGQLVGTVGWLPWSGRGSPLWVSTFTSRVIFCTRYAPNGVIVSVVEQLDDTLYLDASVPVNSIPPGLVPPHGMGPLWWLASGSVTLMDLGTRQMGIYQIDINGNIVPQNNPGENLASAQLIAGQDWTSILEPFVPDASPGQSVHQRMFKRRVSRMAVYVSNSTGFLMARLFSGPLTRTSPALGTIMNTRRVTTYNQDDDPTLPPPLREEAQRWRPIGRAYDPRVAVIKDTPGPLLINEVGLEASI